MGTGCGGLRADTILSLYDTDGTTQLQASDNAFANPDGSLCSWIPFTAPQSAVYFVAVGGNGYGVYNLQILEFNDPLEPNNNDTEAIPIASLPASITGIIGLGSADPDWFSFSGSSGTSYRIAIADHNCQSGDGTDLSLTIYHSDLSNLAADNEAGTQECAEVIVSLSASETILVQVAQHGKSFYDQTYSLEVSEVPEEAAAP